MGNKFNESESFICRECKRNVNPDRFTRVMYFAEGKDIKNYICSECLIPKAIDSVIEHHLHTDQ